MLSHLKLYYKREEERNQTKVSFLLYPVCKSHHHSLPNCRGGGGREVPSKGNNKEKKYKPKKKTTTKSKKETRSGGTNVNRLDKRNITKNMLCAAWGDV